MTLPEPPEPSPEPSEEEKLRREEWRVFRRWEGALLLGLVPLGIAIAWGVYHLLAWVPDWRWTTEAQRRSRTGAHWDLRTALTLVITVPATFMAASQLPKWAVRARHALRRWLGR